MDQSGIGYDTSYPRLNSRTLRLIQNIERMMECVRGYEEGLTRKQLQQLRVWHVATDVEVCNPTILNQMSILAISDKGRWRCGVNLKKRAHLEIVAPVRALFPEELALLMVDERNIDRAFQERLRVSAENHGFCEPKYPLGTILRRDASGVQALAETLKSTRIVVPKDVPNKPGRQPRKPAAKA